MIFLWVPETKQRTLEELDYICASPSFEHSYRLIAGNSRRTYQQTHELPDHESYSVRFQALHPPQRHRSRTAVQVPEYVMIGRSI